MFRARRRRALPFDPGDLTALMPCELLRAQALPAFRPPAAAS